MPITMPGNTSGSIAIWSKIQRALIDARTISQAAKKVMITAMVADVMLTVKLLVIERRTQVSLNAVEYLAGVGSSSAWRDGTWANGRKDDQAMATIGKNCSKGKTSIRSAPSQRHLPSAMRLGRKFLPLMVVNL